MLCRRRWRVQHGIQEFGQVCSAVRSRSQSTPTKTGWPLEEAEVTDARRASACAVGDGLSLYRLLARSVQDSHPDEPKSPPTNPPPTTILTATIETIDNDRAVALMPGLSLS